MLLAPEMVAPRHHWVPDSTSSSADEVVDLAGSVGLGLDPEQRLVLDAMYAERGNCWAAREVALVAPRQNLKTYTFVAACLADMYLFGGPDQLIVWTAHLFPTANEAFIDMKAIIDGSDFLSRRVARITEAAGNQGIELVDGTRLKFLARSKSGGRGFSGAKVYLDESFALTAAQIGALMPTLSAQPNPQIVYGSSAGRLYSDVLRSVRDRGRPGDDPSLAYLEWCAEPGACAADDCLHLPGAEGCVLDDRDRWRQANSAVARGRIDIEFIATERRSMPPGEFMVERLGWWEDPPSVDDDQDDVLDGWAASVTDGAPQDPLALALDVSADLKSAALCVCGGGVVEVVDYRRGMGTDWVPGRVAELRDRHGVTTFGVVAGSPAASMRDDLPSDTTYVSGPESVGACLAFARAINEGRLSHRGQTALDLAVAHAVRAFSGEGWRWSRSKSAMDISPLWAAVVASHLNRGASPAYDPLDNFMPNL